MINCPPVSPATSKSGIKHESLYTKVENILLIVAPALGLSTATHNNPGLRTLPVHQSAPHPRNALPPHPTPTSPRDSYGYGCRTREFMNTIQRAAT